MNFSDVFDLNSALFHKNNLGNYTIDADHYHYVANLYTEIKNHI